MSLKRKAAALLMLVLLFCMPLQTYAATPLLQDSGAVVPTCYHHYDGKIFVYITSKYKKDAKSAIRLLNKKFNVFRYTKYKNKRDVIIKDQSRSPNGNILARTANYNGTIVLYRNKLNKLNRAERIITIAHELGHAAGLDHSSSPYSLMYPSLNGMKAKNFSKADVKSLKKAKRYVDETRKKRNAFRKALLEYEEEGYTIPFPRGVYILAFPKRGTTYRSSNSEILQVYQTGVIVVKNSGNVKLVVNNAGKRYSFKIHVD